MNEHNLQQFLAATRQYFFGLNRSESLPANSITSQVR